MNLPYTNIIDLIPQKHPFVMIDQLDFSDDSTTVCSFRVKEDNIFTVNHTFREAGMIENIAQTAAARVGYIAMQQQQPVPLGFIGAIKNLEILDLPHTGDVLRTEVKIINQVFDVTIISGAVFCNERQLAHCEMKIVIQPEKKTGTENLN
ncbi:MAG: 3-hydroxyacyl-ACP dehydratase [Bacteroidia bacterium]